MPQVKGSASWLDNVRQPPMERRTGIDSSAVKLENEKMEEDMRKMLDSLHLARHRALTDREFALKETKSTARNYTAIQWLAKENNLPVGAPRRPRALASAGTARTQTSTPLARRPQTGFGTASERLGSWAEDSDEEDEAGASPRGDPGRRADGARSPRRRSSARPTRRPRQTFKGRSLREIRRTLYEEFTPEQGEEASDGRSFQELRETSQLDKLHAGQQTSRQTALSSMRERLIAEERARIQGKLTSFYRDIETFKGNPNKHKPRTGYTYVYT